MGADVIERVERALVEVVPVIRETFPDRGWLAATNPSGEAQLAADVRADELLLDRLGSIEGIGSYASEERDDPVPLGEGYALAVDPLDGSSNLATNNPVGTIVGLYDGTLPAAGEALEAAWMLLYGPLTTMVAVHGDSVIETVIEDGSVGERTPVTLPAEPTVYGFGGGVDSWPPAFADFADSIARELKLRYGGAMVADVNQVLVKGGIFSYPSLQGAPQGKLRLQFEAIPMAAIVEAAGGDSSDGSGSLLARSPEDLHERTPVHLGNDALIARLESALG